MDLLKAKTIETFLPTGDATEVSETRITTESIKVVFVDRAQVELQKDRLDFIGCYILSGQDEDGEPSVYVGETENLFSRLLSHKKSKEFWTGAYTIQNTSGTFDKAHLTFLEQLMIEEAQSSERYRLINGNAGKVTTITESKKSECLQFFETIKTLFKTLGFNVFVPVVTKSQLIKEERFYFKHKEGLWDTVGIYSNEKFTVLKGSKTRVKPTKHKEDSRVLRFRDRLIEEGIIEEKDNEMFFVKNYTFNSPSTASNVVSLRSNNGWKVWRNDKNQNLNQLFRKDNK